MKVSQLIWDGEGWKKIRGDDIPDPDLVLFFGGPDITDDSTYQGLRKIFPDSNIVGCTTAGEIIEDDVLDDSLVATAIQFNSTRIKVYKESVTEMAASRKAGALLASKLLNEDLKSVFIISDGQIVNGSELINGVTEQLSCNIIVTGGLAGDNDRFQRTLVSCNDVPKPGVIAAVGFYGENLKVGHGSVGGWDAFGPKRVVSKSRSNILYELDNKPALDLYKKYLGEDAEKLPGSALLFPLMIYDEGSEVKGVVRTVLNTDEKEGTMTFAGDIPEGSIAQLMMANFDRLVDGAGRAAKFAAIEDIQEIDGQKLGILISCVGRKMVLGQRIGDEIEAVREILGEETFQTGFYSYGEISPHKKLGSCELHNQTMTITLLAEDA